MKRKKLIWQLFPLFLMVILLALVAVTAYARYAFRQFYMAQTQHELVRLSRFVSEQILAEDQGLMAPGQVDALCKRLGEIGDTQVRITVILPSGEVIGDSVEQPARMDNHADRPEIIKAIHTGRGWSERPSPTLGIRMFYAAVSVGQPPDVKAVVRSALPTTAIDATLQDILQKVILGGGVIAACAALVSLVISRQISRPIDGMQQIAQRFSTGDLDIRVPIPSTTELASLARALNKMAGQLHDRIQTITAQRNELEAILSTMTEGVIAVDGQGHVVSLNRAAGELLGIDPQASGQRTVEEVIRDVDLRTFVQQVLEGTGPQESDLTLPVDGGRRFRVYGARLPERGEERPGAVIVLHDMTRIYRLENLRRDFVANVSHELKTPVTSIKGFVEALLEGEVEPEQLHYYLGIVAKHADRLNAIIDDLLTLSRLEEDADQRHVTFAEENIEAIARSAIEFAKIKADKKQIQVVLDSNGPCTLRVNVVLMEQAILNLIDNAVKYSEPQSRVTVHIEMQTDGVNISVQDHGCGIPREHQERLFERFYVVDKGRSRRLGGTGLGLAIVKHIAQIHGGRISVQSRLGQGSTFTLHLPRMDDVPSAINKTLT